MVYAPRLAEIDLFFKQSNTFPSESLSFVPMIVIVPIDFVHFTRRTRRQSGPASLFRIAATAAPVHRLAARVVPIEQDAVVQ